VIKLTQCECQHAGKKEEIVMNTSENSKDQVDSTTTEKPPVEADFIPMVDHDPVSKHAALSRHAAVSKIAVLDPG
jgi:hypothetical protein